MTPEQLGTFVQTVGVVGIMAFIGWAFYKRKLVLGSDHDELKKDRDEWKSLALRGLTTADRATTVAAASLARHRNDPNGDTEDHGVHQNVR